MERSRSIPQALAQRARIILLAADGLNNSSVADRLGLSRPTVGKWRQRFWRQGLVGLYDSAKPGGPRSISDAEVASLIRQTLKTKPKDGTHWTCRSLAAETKISRATVHRIWRAFGLQPHRQKHFKWLNQVEIWFNIITQKAIRRGTFHSVKELVAKIQAFVAHYNSKSKPFRWNATADSIFEKIQRPCKAIAETKHQPSNNKYFFNNPASIFNY